MAALVDSTPLNVIGNGLNINTSPYNGQVAIAKGANGSAGYFASAAGATGAVAMSASSNSSTATESQSKSESYSSTKSSSAVNVSASSSMDAALAAAQSQAFAGFLSQAAWMRFSIVAQPDVTAIAQDIRFKEFIGRISSLTIQTVSQQIHSELSTAVSRIVKDLTTNLESRVAVVQSMILDEVLKVTVDTSATTPVEGLSSGLFDNLMTSLNKISATDINKGIITAATNGAVGGKGVVAIAGQTTTGNGVAISSSNSTSQSSSTKTASSNSAAQNAQISSSVSASGAIGGGVVTATKGVINQAANGVVGMGAQITYDGNNFRGQVASIDNQAAGGWSAGGGGQIQSAIQQGSYNGGVSAQIAAGGGAQVASAVQQGWNASNSSSMATSAEQSSSSASSFNQSSAAQAGNQMVGEGTYAAAGLSAGQLAGGQWNNGARIINNGAN